MLKTLSHCEKTPPSLSAERASRYASRVKRCPAPGTHGWLG